MEAYFRPTERAVLLLERVANRLSQASAWDQQVFNQEAFMLSHGAYNGSKVGIRVMHYMQWCVCFERVASCSRAHYRSVPVPWLTLVISSHPLSSVLLSSVLLSLAACSRLLLIPGLTQRSSSSRCGANSSPASRRRWRSSR